MTDFSMTQTETGIPRWTLVSKQAILQESGNVVSLKYPRLEIFRGPQSRKGSTLLSSLDGVYRQSTGDFHLTGNVAVTALNSGQESTRLETDVLDYRSDKQRFETDQPVLVTRGGSRMRGRGMTANRDLTEIQVTHQESILQ